MRGPNRKDVDRELEMVRLYKGGRTLQQIGDLYGMTRERVRQLIARHGVNRFKGGVHKRFLDNQAKKAAAAKARRDARAILYYGCTYDELIELNEGEKPRAPLSSAGKYRQQKNNAISRRVPWAITFPQWLQVWRESGHWEERGRKGELYVMARKGDTGGYAIGNVYITTMAQNAADYQASLKRRGVECADGWVRLPEKASKTSATPRSARIGYGRGWTRTKNGRFQVVLGNEYIGTFATAGEATDAYRKAAAARREAA